MTPRSSDSSSCMARSTAPELLTTSSNLSTLMTCENTKIISGDIAVLAVFAVIFAERLEDAPGLVLDWRYGQRPRPRAGSRAGRSSRTPAPCPLKTCQHISKSALTVSRQHRERGWNLKEHINYYPCLRCLLIHCRNRLFRHLLNSSY